MWVAGCKPDRYLPYDHRLMPEAYEEYLPYSIQLDTLPLRATRPIAKRTLALLYGPHQPHQHTFYTVICMPHGNQG